MLVKDLHFEYPEHLIATSPVVPSRVMWVEEGVPQEITLESLVERIPAGDALVINTTQVVKRRVFTQDGLEILFLQQLSDFDWQVLFPSKKYALGSVIQLPEDHQMTLIEKGRPQIVRTQKMLTEEFFDRVAELPLPPYIQKARGEQGRHNQVEDKNWYQTAWAKHQGSLAAPTASLHFSANQIERLKARGVHVIEVLLHVGLGTFLPVQAEDLKDHVMHSEWVEISGRSAKALAQVKDSGHFVWSLGTTVTRALESWQLGKYFKYSPATESYTGFTDLMIAPGFECKVVDRLLTNFHQPGSTLLALVAAFSDLNTVKSCYSWAINKEFRLFSYGDLSVWIARKK